MCAELYRYEAAAMGGGKGALIQDNLSATLSTSQTQTLFRITKEH